MPMKQPKRITTLKRLGTAIAVLGLTISMPLVQAEDETKIKIKDNKVKIKGGNVPRVVKI
jgi:hypothetical protein